MTKWQRLILWVSLSLNALLVANGLWYHSYASRMAKELLLMDIRSGIRTNESDLQKIQSNNPEDIRSLTEALRIRIVEGKKQAEQWQKALE